MNAELAYTCIENNPMFIVERVSGVVLYHISSTHPFILIRLLVLPFCPSLSRAACVTQDDYISSVWSRAAQPSFCISLAVSVHSWAWPTKLCSEPEFPLSHWLLFGHVTALTSSCPPHASPPVVKSALQKNGDFAPIQQLDEEKCEWFCAPCK